MARRHRLLLVSWKRYALRAFCPERSSFSDQKGGTHYTPSVAGPRAL